MGQKAPHCFTVLCRLYHMGTLQCTDYHTLRWREVCALQPFTVLSSPFFSPIWGPFSSATVIV